MLKSTPPTKLAVPAEGNWYGYFTKLFTLSTLLASVSFVLYWSFLTAGSTPHWPDGAAHESLFRSGPDDSAATNISHLLFGIGGSLQTWHDRRRYAALWWDPNSTRGYAWLDGKPNATDDNSPVPCRVSSDWTRFRSVNPLSAARMARIVAEGFKLGLPGVRWFVMGDDDTVFFTENLVAALGRLDHHQMYYMGSPGSESVEQDVVHAYDMAFGGGGFAVSYALAAYLARELDGCLGRYGSLYGSDQRVFACVAEIGVGLTKHRGFHQFDIRGDPYGILAAHPLAPLVSLHHLDAVSPMFPNQTQLESAKTLHQAYRTDPGRALQQSFCFDHKRNWAISVSWGYTVQLYPYFMSPMDLQTPLQTFRTWRTWSDGPFTFNTRPVSSDPCEQPLTFFLRQAEEVGGVGTRTVYKRFVPGTGKACDKAEYVGTNELQRITVSATKMSHDYWDKVPRRQCCEMQNGGRIIKGTMHIRIRKCRPRETLTT